MSTESSDHVAIVTGSNTGIGEVTAKELARSGRQVWLACRSLERAEAAVARIRAEVPDAQLEILPLDLGSLDAVRKSAESFLSRGLPLHLLVNNAGLAGQRGQTSDGFELSFGVNHLGPFLFTRLLEDRLRATAQQAGGARIVNVASRAHTRARGIDWDALRRPTRTITAYPEYSVSKLCNVLFTRAHARRLAGSGVTTYALHPGVVASDIWRSVPWPIRPIMRLWMITNEEGAKTQLHCATSPEVASESGLYYDLCKPREPSSVARDEALAEELWRRSEAWTGLSAA
ncbi:MAG: SDR family oxidoreductase [Myxococcales bacterium]|nr:SDR family oxidoreductase [Myxococcales bacterium]